ncbi:MAG TPA: DegQ family serine endoprotease [Candidatus Paceibacterota bacterium]|nr:DegQ family serine endoprotease [Candidatus Paceibacterota bacterium]HSA00410.1 DegQ family serine endoprotease [Candidatus Paceibacterota bacterium]
MKNPAKNRVLTWTLAAVAGLLLYSFSGNALDRPEKTQSSKKSKAEVQVETSPPARGNTAVHSYAPVIQKTAPGVVNIFTSRVVKADPRRSMPFWGGDPMFRYFFGPEDNNPSQPRARKERSLGSGVIMTKDGYILTNDHVVDGADEVKVALANHNKKEFTAKIVGRDPRTDIALLKVETEDLPAVTVADSDAVEVGDVVLAIGNPFGLGQTVTMGIVSAVGRNNVGIEDYEDFIQTDAAINPGNSGGALIDAQGRVIGINTAILSRTGGNQGIGFAVPINLARNIMDRLLQDGKVTRGYMGVMIQELNPDLAKEFKSETSQGALVSDVTEDSPAAKAGIKTGDIIVKLDDKPIKSSHQLRMTVAQKAPGTTVQVQVLRDGQTKNLRVTLAEMPDQDDGKGSALHSDRESSDGLDGVGVTDLDSAMRRQLRLPSNLQGAFVTEVEPESAAYEAGLRRGDVILEINRKAVRNAADAVEATKNLKGKKITLRIWSQGGSRYIVVDESER